MNRTKLTSLKYEVASQGVNVVDLDLFPSRMQRKFLRQIQRALRKRKIARIQPQREGSVSE